MHEAELPPWIQGHCEEDLQKQFPALHASFREAIACLGGMKPEPELFVKSDPRPNAYTLAVRGGAPFVVVTSALVDGFSAAETQAVLGHELGHLVCENSLWFSLRSIGSTLLPPLPGVGAAAEGVEPARGVDPTRGVRLLDGAALPADMGAAPEPLGPARTAAVWEDEDAAGAKAQSSSRRRKHGKRRNPQSTKKWW